MYDKNLKMQPVTTIIYFFMKKKPAYLDNKIPG